MRVAFQLSTLKHTLLIEFGKDELSQNGPPYSETMPTPMQVQAEPLGFRRLDDPLQPSVDSAAVPR